MKRLLLISVVILAAVSAVPITLALLYPQPHSWAMVATVVKLKLIAIGTLFALYAVYVLIERAARRAIRAQAP